MLFVLAPEIMVELPVIDQLYPEALSTGVTEKTTVSPKQMIEGPLMVSAAPGGIPS